MIQIHFYIILNGKKKLERSRQLKTVVEIIESTESESALLKLHEVTPIINKALSILEAEELSLIGEDDGTLYKVSYSVILYIEVVDKKSFIYTKQSVYQSSEKLYQLEDKMNSFGFIRVSKSMLLNSEAIQAIAPMLSGRFEALLVNDERVAISRKYVPDLKKGLGMERKS